MQNSWESWQVETQGQIYQANIEELKQWIAEGAVLVTDKVKRGNLRWLPVGKVPELSAVFSSEDFNDGMPEIPPANDSASCDSLDGIIAASEDIKEEALWEVQGEKVCSVHAAAAADYACWICKKMYCKICPNSYGASVKLCPQCGSLCRSADETFVVEQKIIGAVSKPYYKADEVVNPPVAEKRVKFPAANCSKLFSYTARFVKESISEAISSVSSSSSTLRR